ncbi:MAG: ATP-binding protein [Gaiellaceae bacterium]
MASTIPDSRFELLERNDQLEALTAALAAVDETGRGKLALVRGEAGVGKTTLVDAFVGSLHSRRVLRGACEPLDTPSPLGPFLDIADEIGGELAGIAAGGPPPYALTAELLRELDQRPAVVLIEDIHWADEATLDVLRLLTRRLEAVPVLVIVTYRDDEITRTHPLRTVLGEFGARAVRVPVPVLSPAAVAALAGATEFDADALYRRTNGNPFFVTEALAAGGDGVPETVRDAVVARAARLSPDARRLLDAVAVVPPSIERTLLDQLMPDADSALDECTTTGMLRAGDGRISFRHELARLAIEDDLPPGTRRGLHRSVLAALGDVDPARLAHHAEQAEDIDAILRFAPEAAARAAAVSAHREAAEQYARALRFGDGIDASLRAEWLTQRGISCYVTDQVDEAIEAMRLAASLFHELGDALGEGHALWRLGQYLWDPGRVDEAFEACRGATVVLEPLGPSRELGFAYNQLSFLCSLQPQADEARKWNEQLLAVADATKDPELEVIALESRAGRDAACELAIERGLITRAGIIHSDLAGDALWVRDFATADRKGAAALAFCSDHGLELLRNYILSYLATSALDQGRWDAAVDWADELFRIPRQATSPRMLALTVVGLVRARRGDPDPWSPLEEAYELGVFSGEVTRMFRPAAARAEAAWLEGRDAEIGELTEHAYRLAVERRSGEAVGALGMWRRRVGLPVDLIDEVEDWHGRLDLAGEPAAAAARWAEIGCPYEAAVALADSGDEAALRQAVDELQRLGASAAVARLRRTGVRGLPRGPRRSTRENPSNLTTREVEVLRLLTEGLRNSEIADRLVLSERTVHHHVSAILRKLEAGSRTEAAARASALGIS